MLALKNRPENSEYGHQNDGRPEGDQSAPYRRTNAVRGIIGADVPTDIDPGADENEENRFYGPSSAFMRSVQIWKIIKVGKRAFLTQRVVRAVWFDRVNLSPCYNINQIHKSNQ